MPMRRLSVRSSTDATKMAIWPLISAIILLCMTRSLLFVTFGSTSTALGEFPNGHLGHNGSLGLSCCARNIKVIATYSRFNSLDPNSAERKWFAGIEVYPLITDFEIWYLIFTVYGDVDEFSAAIYAGAMVGCSPGEIVDEKFNFWPISLRRAWLGSTEFRSRGAIFARWGPSADSEFERTLTTPKSFEYTSCYLNAKWNLRRRACSRWKHHYGWKFGFMWWPFVSTNLLMLNFECGALSGFGDRHGVARDLFFKFCGNSKLWRCKEGMVK